MTVRVRGIVASMLLVVFVFMSIGVFLPRKAVGHQNLGRFTTTKDEDVDFRLLIGVMSPSWSLARRQIIRNAYRQFPSNLPVDVVFVQANTASFNENNNDRVMAMHQIAMTWENDTFHDILHLDCAENLVEGKTYEYLRKVGSERSTKYTHVMKTDDDSFVNIPGIPIPYNADGSPPSSCIRTSKTKQVLLGDDMARWTMASGNVGIRVHTQHGFGQMDIRVGHSATRSGGI